MNQSKVAVVLGVGPGLGAAIAHRFAREGFAIGLMACSEDQLAQIQTEIENSGGKALSIPADFTEPTSPSLNLLNQRPPVQPATHDTYRHSNTRVGK